MTFARRILDKLIEVRRAGPGRPSFPEWIEIIALAALFAVAFLTPEHRADGSANAPLETTIQSWTGGGLCVYKRVTGIPCPGCGLSHGFVHLAHGHPFDAIAANPLTPVVFVTLFARFVADLFLLFGLDVTNRFSPRTAFRLWLAFGVSVFMLWAWRLIAHFTWP